MEYLFRTYAFIFGACIGSFLNVLIYRLPREIDTVKERSICPSCKKIIPWYENVPIFGYLFLRGKCSACSAKIPFRYFGIELCMGLAGAWLYPAEPTLPNMVNAIFYFSVLSVFVAHFFIDLEFQILPDKLNLYLLAISLPYAFMNYPWEYVLLGGAIGFLGPLSITWLFYKVRGQVGLGGGDIKLYGILGLMLGPIGILNTIFLSCFLGAVWAGLMISIKKMSKETPMAFGPFILIIGFFQLFFPQLIHWVTLI